MTRCKATIRVGAKTYRCEWPYEHSRLASYHYFSDFNTKHKRHVVSISWIDERKPAKRKGARRK